MGTALRSLRKSVADFFERPYWRRVRYTAWQRTVAWIKENVGTEFLMAGIPALATGLYHYLLGVTPLTSLLTSIAVALGSWLLTGAAIFVYYYNVTPARLPTSLTSGKAIELSDLSPLAQRMLSEVGQRGIFHITRRGGDLQTVWTDTGPLIGGWFSEHLDPKDRLRLLSGLDELKSKGVVDQDSDTAFPLSLDVGWPFVETLTANELQSIIQQHGELSEGQLLVLRTIILPTLPQVVADLKRATGQDWDFRKVTEVWNSIPDAFKNPRPSDDKLSNVARRYLRAKAILSRRDPS